MVKDRQPRPQGHMRMCSSILGLSFVALHILCTYTFDAVFVMHSVPSDPWQPGKVLRIRMAQAYQRMMKSRLMLQHACILFGRVDMQRSTPNYRLRSSLSTPSHLKVASYRKTLSDRSQLVSTTPSSLRLPMLSFAQRMRSLLKMRDALLFPKPHYHRRLMLSQDLNPSTSRAKWSAGLSIGLGLITSGILGYYVGTSGVFSQPLVGRTDVIKAPQYGSSEDFQRAIKELKATFNSPEIVSIDPEDLRIHGYSEDDPGAVHTVVVYPSSTDDVVKIVKIANKYRMPLVPFSAGTSLEGSFRGSQKGGMCVDMSKMDKILEIHEADSDLVCQPGVGWMQINDTLQEKGIPLFFPLDPGPGATLGGMMSTGCSGTNAVRYGTARGEWFLNATVVLPSGEVIKTRRRARKSSVGFDLTNLFIGAEGTLGIITEVTVRLTPVLPTTVAIVQFPNVKHATEAVIDIINRGVGIQCVELCDSQFMRATNLFGASKRRYPEVDSVFFKFQGPTPASIAETAAIVEETVKRHGSTGFELARTEKEAQDLWADRKNALYSSVALVEGSKGWQTDVCVPVSRLPDLVYETKKDFQRIGLSSIIVGHVGDGNFHANILFRTGEELAIAQDAAHRIVERAIGMDGTCTGEHGVGIGKKKYLYEELGKGTVELMRAIKKTIDPLWLFNPGKLYPDEEAEISSA